MRRMARYNPSNNRLNNRPQSNYIFSLLAAGTMTIVGFILSTPFWWFMIIIGDEANISIWRTLAVVAVVIGFPMLLLGLIGVIGRRSLGGYSTLENDVSRIRFAAETHMMSDVLKGNK